MSQKKVLSVIGDFWKAAEGLLQLDRLERLASKTTVGNLAYQEALMHANYVLLTWDRHVVFKTGTVEGIFDFLGMIFNLPDDWFPGELIFQNTFEGKLSAVGFCFAHSAGKIDAAISVDAFRNLMMSFDHIVDVVGRAATASRVGLSVKGLPALPKLPKPKKG